MREDIVIQKQRTHLDLSIPGVKPIFASVLGKSHDFDDKDFGGDKAREEFEHDIVQEVKAMEEKFSAVSTTAKNVDYYATPDVLGKENLLNSGEATYVISSISNEDKFSEELYDCTGIIVAGIDKETGENISFSSHQDPKKFLPDDNLKERFIYDLQRRLNEMKDRCLPGTIDAVIVGGTYKKDLPDYYATSGVYTKGVIYRKNYLDSIKLLGDEIKNVLGFEPTIANGPKTKSEDQADYDSYLYKNEFRRIFFLRSHNTKIGDFLPKDTVKALSDRPEQLDQIVEKLEKAGLTESTLLDVAEKCMSRGFILEKVRNLLAQGVNIEKFDIAPGSSFPEAFIVSAGEDVGWFIPNTRDWFSFRDKGLFNPNGKDFNGLRIKKIIRLPLTSKDGKKVIVPGEVELSF